MTNRSSQNSTTQTSDPSDPIATRSSFFARLYNVLPDGLALSSLTSVRQKIGWGYAIVVGVTLLGTAIGVGIDHANRREANLRTVEIATQQLQIERLQVQMLLVRAYTAELAIASLQSDDLDGQLTELHRQIETCLALLQRLPGAGDESAKMAKTMADDVSPTIMSQTRQAIADQVPISLPLNGLRLPEPVNDPSQSKIQALQAQWQDYETAIRDYDRRIESIIEPLETNTGLTIAGRAQLLSELSKFIESSEYQVFSQSAYQLSEFSAQLDEINGWLVANTERADRLSLRIWLVSLCLSIAVTAGAIVYLSGIISYPLVCATSIARRITEESNYSLRLPKLSNDEIGTLSEAIGTLVQQVETDHQNIKDAQTHLIQAEKMSSLGQMVAGVAHEINNPVNFIYGNLAHLESSVQDVIEVIDRYQATYPEPVDEIADLLEEVEFDYLREDIPKQISSMRMGAERIRQIVLSLRNFSRLDEAATKHVNLHDGIDSTLTLLAHRLKANIEIIKKYGEIPAIECCPAQLNQVWMNILTNAIDALEEVVERFDGALSSPKITIETLAQAQTVTIKIRDNGAGISEDLLTNIFDPFFTTKPIGKGTGLGLSICFAIIERHGGTMRVRSQLDIGTEFTFILPIALDVTTIETPRRQFERLIHSA
jgi:signal transduction histidine kinase